MEEVEESEGPLLSESWTVDGPTSSIGAVEELKIEESNGAALFDSSIVDGSTSLVEEADYSCHSGGNVRSRCSTICTSERRWRPWAMPKLASSEALRFGVRA